jgi:hypothetical protein
MRGCAASVSVIRRANTSRSTASAWPAGTAASSAAAITSEPSRRISSLSRPTALDTRFERSELLHTSSANQSAVCAGERSTGFMSTRVTSRPRRAACHAASQPASPAPMTTTCKSKSVAY